MPPFKVKIERIAGDRFSTEPGCCASRFGCLSAFYSSPAAYWEACETWFHPRALHSDLYAPPPFRESL
jgi:hypothetical protein